jgi:hypothetical protein
MEARTHQHLARADHHRDIALALLEHTSRSRLHPPAYDWTVVAAFYAAVHYVNAYLWELRRYEPPDHNARRRVMAGDRSLQAAIQSYASLRARAFQARYRQDYRPSRLHAELATRQLRRVERVVRSALDRASRR